MTLSAYIVWATVAVSSAVVGRQLWELRLARRHRRMAEAVERRARAELHATCERIVAEARAGDRFVSPMLRKLRGDSP